MAELPVVDLEIFIRERKGDLSPEVKRQCDLVANCLKQAGALVLRDPRCSPEDNDRFLDMMERYFGMPDEFKRQQERPHLHYQVGVTPEGVEVPRSALDKEMQESLKRIPDSERPQLRSGPDPKWRYMWRVGPRPANTRFKELNSEPVIPEGFPEWVDVMDGWGRKMIAAVEVVAEMAAIGFGLEPTAFTSLMFQGPHLLAPTGSDLSKYAKEGTVFAGYHYDLNFLTIHGRSRFPGLHIWLKHGRKMLVRVPPGCLLVQAGKQVQCLCLLRLMRTILQLEWLTGGECSAGMHEVIVTKETLAAVERAKQEGRSLWRVSSTVFGHIASDAVLQPLGHFTSAPNASNYPPIVAGDYVESELAVISLKLKDSPNAGCSPVKVANDSTHIATTV